MKKVKMAAVAALSLAATGCAITSSSPNGPNGAAVHWIDAPTARLAYEKASEFCPQGYNILGNPYQAGLLDYVMTVECKLERYGEDKPKSKPGERYYDFDKREFVE